MNKLFLEAGFPAGAFQTLLIGSQQVDAILNDPRVVAATLTGSEQAGIEVGVAAAKRIKKVVLELGGSDPFIVMPSADLDAAVATGSRPALSTTANPASPPNVSSSTNPSPPTSKKNLSIA